MPLLNWLDKDGATKASAKSAYRLLEERSDLSYGDANSENLLVQGDNLETLKALLPFYAGKVKCIYIDPPYNTKSAFEHYDDNLEHSKWLSLIYPRLEILWNLLSDEGSIWISCDDSESHYLKVICDEVFGRDTFIASNIWQKRYSRENREAIGDVHEFIFTYAKNRDLFKKSRSKLPLTEAQAKVYKNPNNDPKGRWRGIPMTAQGYRPNQMYEIISPSGAIHTPPEGRCWSTIEENYLKLRDEGRIYFGKNGDSQPNTVRYLSEVEGITPWTWWPSDEVGHTDESKKEIHAIFGKKDAFDTPKPERLIERILHIASNEGDLILDSFLGSATTAAVAHKMNRRYIGIEIGEHAKTHCQPRLKKVVDGEQGGISKAVNWQGGGGFRFCQLGPTVFDEYGLLNSEIKFPTLAAHVWYIETKHPKKTEVANDNHLSPLVGINNGIAYFLLYNGILGDRRPNGGNVLTRKVLEHLEEVLANADPLFDGQRIVYGETSRLGEARLQQGNITFKQIPYDVKAL